MNKNIIIALVLSSLSLTVSAADKRLNYHKMASEAFTMAEDLAIEDKNCPVTEDSFQTVFYHPNLKRFNFEHILYKEGLPYAGFQNKGNFYSYAQAYTGQWEYRAEVFNGQEVRFAKFRNSTSKLVSLGNQTVAKMNDFLYGPRRFYRVFCAVHEEVGVNGFNKPYSIRRTKQIIQTPNVAEAKAVLKECVKKWFVAPMKRDFCQRP